MFPTIATSTGSSVLANVSAAFADAGTLTILALAAGLPLAFWAIRQVIGLFPKSRSRVS